MRKWLVRAIAVVVVGLVAFLVLCAYIAYYYQQLYPYGRSHSCDKGLMFALHQYAEDHGGAYPTGGQCPEASLGLLYPEYADAETLCGKIVPLENVRSRLEQRLPLTPETCGWHYVEGLKISDDKRLALVWDKARLGHNGERYSDGRTNVLLVDMGSKQVTAKDWAAFMAEQEELHKEPKVLPAVE